MGVIIKNPDILGGTPVFRGTRVPIQTMVDYLEGGETRPRLPNGPLRRAGRIEEWRPSYRRGNSQVRRFPYRGSRNRIPAKSNCPKARNYHFRAKSKSLKDLLPLVPACLAHMKSIQPGQIVTIEG